MDRSRRSASATGSIRTPSPTAPTTPQRKTAGSGDAQLLPMDLAQLVPGGVRIGRGTQDKLSVEVRDDVTGLVEFTVRVMGYRHYP